MNTRPPYLGEFEYVVLLAVLHPDDPCAVPICRILEQPTGRPVTRGALYTVLERLEAILEGQR